MSHRRKGWTWTSQRFGRYKYQKLLVHTTNPDHLVPSTPSLTDIPPLEVAPRYRRDDGFTMTGEGVEVLVGDPARSQYDPVACGSTRAPNLPNAVSASIATTRSSWRTCAKLDPAQGRRGGGHGP
jgi:hypothetical protein